MGWWRGREGAVRRGAGLRGPVGRWRACSKRQCCSNLRHDITESVVCNTPRPSGSAMLGRTSEAVPTCGRGRRARWVMLARNAVRRDGRDRRHLHRAGFERLHLVGGGGNVDVVGLLVDGGDRSGLHELDAGEVAERNVHAHQLAEQQHVRRHIRAEPVERVVGRCEERELGLADVDVGGREVGGLEGGRELVQPQTGRELDE